MTDAEHQTPDDALLGVQPWDRRPGEPLFWYSRFEKFRRMGPTRSLLRLYREERAARKQEQAKPGAITGIPRAWVNAAQRWNWRARAEAWDVAEVIRAREEQEQERAEARQRRLDLLRSFGDKLEQAIQKLDPEEVGVSELANALRSLLEQSRVEYGEPSQRVDLVWQLREIAEQFDVDWRELRDEYERLKRERRDGGSAERG